MKTYGLPCTEYQIMEFFWQSQKPMVFREILEYFNTEHEKNWKRQTLNTYLLNLKNRGLIRATPYHSGYEYTPSCTKGQLIKRWAENVMTDFFDGSFKQLACALSGGAKISDEYAQELKDLVDELFSDEEKSEEKD